MRTGIAERFAKDTGGWTSEDGTQSTRPHEMTVLHDEGLYRHLRFRSPDTGVYWFDLITWPGCLTVNGDCGTFTFSREEDMFGFFRGRQVNPQYWAEKVRGETRTRTYSEQRFREQVTEAAEEAAATWPGLAEAVEERIFGDFAGWDITQDHDAHLALGAFEHGATFTVTCPTCGTLAEGLGDENEADRQCTRHTLNERALSGHLAMPGKVDGFRFAYAWEWDLQDYDWWFLWSCHAIAWGIARYDAQRAGVPS
jgi:hypothetical protein